jgi:hypothetical protein
LARGIAERQDLGRDAGEVEPPDEGAVLGENDVRRYSVEVGEEAQQRDLAAGETGDVVQVDDLQTTVGG